MEKLTELLATLATKLGTTVEYLWGVLIKQAQVSGILSAIFISIILIIGIVLFFATKYNFVSEEETTTDEDIVNIFFLWGWFAYLVLFILVLSISLPNLITAFGNPEYWALQNILEKL